MKQTILITGASGSLAKLFTATFQDKYNFKFLTRRPNGPAEYKWDITKRELDIEAMQGVDVIVHLAGANIAGSRWTVSRKKELCDSRIETAKILAEEAAKNNIKFKKVISASAVGYYGSHTSEHIYNEDNSAAKDFLGQLCKEWEESAALFKSNELTNSVVCLRLGVILSENSGVIDRIKLPTQYCLGSALGSGKQYVPWIHELDVCQLIDHAINTPSMTGSYNAVAPEHITNKELTKSIAETLKKPYFLPAVPAAILKVVFGEMSTVVLEGSRVSSKKLAESGFKWKFRELGPALEDLLNS